MDELTLVATAVIAALTGGGLALAYPQLKRFLPVRYVGVEPGAPPLRWGDRSPHTHAYGVVLADGRGMRCYHCGKPKGSP